MFYAYKIIEDGFCVTQNAIKQMPEQLYLFRKKGTIKNKKKQGWELDQVPLKAPINSNSNQLSLDAKTNNTLRVMTGLVQIGN